MASSNTRTIPWVIEPQTKVKHSLLKQYMAVWMKILWSQQASMRKPQHLIYVDGFSGPGEYWETDAREQLVPGSPIIVGNTANDLISENPARRIDIVAIDAHAPTADYLTPRLNGINTHRQNWTVIHGDFSTTAEEILRRLDAGTWSSNPTFFFIDPFGYSGFPLTLLSRILRHPMTELFINFMAYDIVRFMGQPNFKEHMLELFGTEKYSEYTKCSTPEDRVSFIATLYYSQLRLAGAKHVIPFRINTPGQGDRAKYFLFHASKHIKALKLMKDTMAKASDREFSFEAIGLDPNEQLMLFAATPESQIKSKIHARYSTEAQRPVPYQIIEDWAYDATPAISSQIKIALMDLEREGRIKINRGPRQRSTTVTSPATIEFLRG
jgi:three-Cys-motif partner protein